MPPEQECPFKYFGACSFNYYIRVLKEAGTRTPGAVSQSLSIVGALVLGTAAVEARLVSAPMIIIVGITAVTGLMMPNISGTLTILRIYLLLLSSGLGLYGYIFGILSIIIHLFSLRSCGIPFMRKLSYTSSANRKRMQSYVHQAGI